MLRAPTRGDRTGVLAVRALNKLLAAIVEKAEFEIRRNVATDDGRSNPVWRRRVSAPEPREFYFGRQDQVVRRNVRVSAPEALASQLVDTQRQFLKDFVDPETDRIEQAFPIAGYHSSASETRADGLVDDEFTSLLPDLPRALVQSVATTGAERRMELLTDWKQGEPIRVHLSTVLNNLYLAAPVSQRPEI